MIHVRGTILITRRPRLFQSGFAFNKKCHARYPIEFRRILEGFHLAKKSIRSKKYGNTGIAIQKVSVLFDPKTKSSPQWCYRSGSCSLSRLRERAGVRVFF